ncbi:hypothetical protein M2135_001675 [Parabacteroides sp. PF5-9]|nr:hypothetical protein [Parabacteroides sp. PF5-9]
MPIFIASRISLDDNVLFPDRIDIDHNNVTFYKGYILGYRSMVIPRNNIASVSIGSGIFFADVTIESVGGKRIVGSGFIKRDTMEIVRLLT